MRRVCFFGIYERTGERTTVLRRGFEAHGYEVAECRVDPKTYPGLRKYVALMRAWYALPRRDFSLVLVCFPGQPLVWLARALFGKHVVLDAFVSLYDSNVDDRGLYSARSLRAWRDWLYDVSSAWLAWRVLVDTDAHCAYFHKRLGIARKKLIRVLVSADAQLFVPREPLPPREVCVVEFHGRFIPLHGVPHILDAAKILEREAIVFRMTGAGQEDARIRAHAERLGLSTVEFLPVCPLSELPSRIAMADICLGIFGDTDKARRVVPHKVFEALAMGKPIITMDTPAARELLVHDETSLLVSNNPTALATAILDLARDPLKRVRLGAAARALFESRLQPADVVAPLIRAIDSV